MANADDNEAGPAANGKAEGSPPNATGGKRERSETPYPYFGLGRGIEIVEAVRRAGGNEASSVDVMRELGVVKTTDRVWGYGIPAAQYFGLIERVGRGDEGRIKLTDLAMRIVLPGTPDEGRLSDALRDARSARSVAEKHGDQNVASGALLWEKLRLAQRSEVSPAELRQAVDTVRAANITLTSLPRGIMIEAERWLSER